MTFKKILNIKPLIVKGQQRFAFTVEGRETPIYLHLNQIRHNLGHIPTYEIEILIGSLLRADFYEKDEILSDNEVCREGNILVRDSWITTSRTLEEMRENKTELRQFKKILNIWTYNKRNKDRGVGIDVGQGQHVWFDAKRLEALTGITNFDLLIESYISPEYYQEGELLFPPENGQYCNKSEVIIKNLNLRLVGSLDDLYELWLDKQFEKEMAAEDRLKDMEEREMYRESNFDALTDGQLGRYDDFEGDIDDVRDWGGF